MTILASVNNKTLMPGITPIADVPDAPTIGTATAAGLSASITFTPATTGGTGTTYTAISTPGLITGTSSSSPVSVSGLTSGTSYTFTVRASNSTGNSALSASSNSVDALLIVDSGYDALATVTVPSGGLSSITFSGIPTGYRHLQLRILTRATYVPPPDTGGILNFNGDNGSNYSWHRMYGDGGTPAVGASANASFARIDRMSGGSTTSNVFGAMIVDILDYADTSKNKVVRSIGGYDANGTGWIGLNSAVWRNNAAISSITFANADSTNLVQHTRAALYGVK